MSAARLAWKIENLSAAEADIYLYDIIGDPFEGVTAMDFVKELRALDGIATLNLHINSPGGYVSDALAIYNALQQHPATVIALIESQAASAASFVAMAADTVKIAPRAQIMIHDAHGIGVGNARDMLTLANMLDEESANIAAIYADKTGKPTSDWREAMQANDGVGTTYRGQAAVDIGLADEVMTVPVRAQTPHPMRAMAQAEPPSIVVPADFGAAFREDTARLKPVAYLEALLKRQFASEPLSEALKGAQ